MAKPPNSDVILIGGVGVGIAAALGVGLPIAAAAALAGGAAALSVYGHRAHALLFLGLLALLPFQGYFPVGGGIDLSLAWVLLMGVGIMVVPRIHLTCASPDHQRGSLPLLLRRSSLYRRLSLSSVRFCTLGTACASV